MVTYRMEDLRKLSEEPLLKQLISVAEKNETVYYSELAKILSHKVVPGHVSDQQIGPLVGHLMSAIWALSPNAPPINMLVVSKAKGIASEGSDEYLRRYFHLNKLPRSESRKLELVTQAILDVWNFDEWSQIYTALFERNFALEESRGIEQFDEDGQGDNPLHKRGPESLEHKRLKEFVCDNLPLFGLRGVLESAIEKRLLSGDELDVFVVTKTSRIGIEVKSCRSGDPDLIRGIYQCVKYRAVLQAQFGHLSDRPECDAFLVTEEPLSPEIRKIAKRLSVRTVVQRVNVR